MARLDWTRDELILALDLYFREPSARGSKTHPGVQELSALLNALPIYPLEKREPQFRNPNGVGMKLSNFLRFDPEYTGSGLPGGAKLEAEVWSTFAANRARLSQAAEAIRKFADAEYDLPELDVDNAADAEAAEGRLLTRLHKSRERSRRLVKKKKDAVLSVTGRLACEACKFDFAAVYGAIGSGFAECHHIKPVSELVPGEKTRLSDLAILCANCHRIVHRKRPWLRVDELAAVIEELRASS